LQSGFSPARIRSAPSPRARHRAGATRSRKTPLPRDCNVDGHILVDDDPIRKCLACGHILTLEDQVAQVVHREHDELTNELDVAHDGTW
jgi:hypothetical protein